MTIIQEYVLHIVFVYKKFTLKLRIADNLNII